MSVHETMPETTTKPAVKKSGKKATAPRASVEAVLENAATVMHALDQLILSPHQARNMPHTVSEIRELADSIARVGLLQNLAGHTMPDGKTGICAGGGRMKAVMLLTAEGRWPADRPLPVLMVPEDMARVVSMTENGKRRDMHVSEQIVNFRALTEEGRSEGQIADLLGFSVTHVRRCLKLADLSPALMCLLREDRITVAHCQALTLAGTPERQDQIWEAAVAKVYGGNLPSPDMLKRLATDTDIRTTSALFGFVGREAYETAGGAVQEDLFSDDEGGWADALLTEKLALEKLRAVAEDVRGREGWGFADARLSQVKTWADRDTWCFLPEPPPQFSEDEAERVAQFEFVIENDEFDTDEDEQAAYEELAALTATATTRGWRAEDKARSWIVVSLDDGEVVIQRGLALVADQQTETEEDGTDDSETDSGQAAPPEKGVEAYSAALVRSMSCERTLAVQAALFQQPDTALTLLTWTLCRQVFGGSGLGHSPVSITLHTRTGAMSAQAHTGTDGRGYREMQHEEGALRELLPEGWKFDFTLLAALPLDTLKRLLAFCVASSLDGEQVRVNGHTPVSALDATEAALFFHLRDWWQPDAAFFGRMSKAQTADALEATGRGDLARGAEKMKKGDAAELAAQTVADSRWLPEWLSAPLPDTDTESATKHD